MPLNLKTALAGATLGLALLFSGAAHGQSVQSAKSGSHVSSLEKHCDDIRGVFELARFKGEYQKRTNIWLKDNCRGAVPYPSLGRS